MYESKKVQTFESDVRLEISRNFEQDIDIFDDIDISEKKSLSSLSGDNLKLACKRDFSLLINGDQTKKDLRYFNQC